MLAIKQATRAPKRAAGAKKTARRRQGYGELAYLPAEASAKAGALFDIVNMESAAGRAALVLHPELGSPEPGRLQLSGGITRLRASGPHFVKRRHVAEMPQDDAATNEARPPTAAPPVIPCCLQGRVVLHTQVVWTRSLFHIGLKARSSSTSMSSAPPPFNPWATRSVASCTVFARSALTPSERASPTKSIFGSSSSMPT
jgi:hypothetical protein